MTPPGGQQVPAYSSCGLPGFDLHTEPVQGDALAEGKYVIKGSEMHPLPGAHTCHILPAAIGEIRTHEKPCLDPAGVNRHDRHFLYSVLLNKQGKPIWFHKSLLLNVNACNG
jgi:hypothetical protein